ncbi:hypothetical protein LWF01_06075 [Saxibacter everestensis]|uniref:DUF7455 domain-containing protein n=1 Tax=Saxibacter everestensis TaxID=2909229 RepID=A0ABY8QWJ4_9MICO|nr:hypothetical protein LWF01_06075 [Brevibacteriaceae bacterium ZFBP1038]
MTDSATLEAPLTVADRCDQCGAQAFLRVHLNSGELLFCAHHGRKHQDALRATAVRVQDETDKLVENV